MWRNKFTIGLSTGGLFYLLIVLILDRTSSRLCSSPPFVCWLLSGLRFFPVFQGSIALATQTSGYEVFARCETIAIMNNADYFGLTNGTICVYELTTPDNFSIHGISDHCTSVCGSDKTSSGMQCGGIHTISVFKTGVKTLYTY